MVQEDPLTAMRLKELIEKDDLKVREKREKTEKKHFLGFLLTAYLFIQLKESTFSFGGRDELNQLLSDDENEVSFFPSLL